MTVQDAEQEEGATSSTPRPKNDADRRLLIAELALPLLLLAVLEIGLRLYAASPASAFTPGFFPFPITNYKYLAYRRLIRQEQREDVIFLGTSQNMRIDMRRLREKLRERGLPLRSFNFSGPSHWVGFDQRFLSDILIRIGKPSVVVYGIIPLNLLWEKADAGTDRLIQTLPAFSLYDGTPAAELRGLLFHHVALMTYRSSLRAWLTGRGMTASVASDKIGRMIGPFGDDGTSPRKAKVARLRGYEVRYRNQLRGFDALLRNSPLFTDILHLARLCKDRGIRLVVLSNPVHPLFVEMLPGGQRDYNRFVQRLRDTAKRADVSLCEPEGGSFGPPGLYTDTHHPNARGSMWITDEVAKCLLQEGIAGAGSRDVGASRAKRSQ